MAEGRMLKKRISKSKKFAQLKSNNARLLYLLIYPHLDYEGRLDADPNLIKGEITPLLSFSAYKIMEYLEDMNNVGLIILYEDDGDLFLEYTRFKDFQTLRHDREAPSKLPNPKELQRHSGGTPAKVKLSKVKLSKDKISISKDNIISEPSAAVTALENVYKDGFNIYSLIGRFKKERGWTKEQNLPDEVAIGISLQYFKDKSKIKQPWPWFMKVLRVKAEEWSANENIRISQEGKKAQIAPSIKDLLRDIIK